MSRRSLSLFAPLFLVAALPGGAVQDTQDDGKTPVIGRIVDAAGHPVAGARAATSWSFQGGRPSAYGAMQVDDEGRFSGRVRAWQDPFGLAAYNEDGTLAGYTMVPKDGDTEVTIVVEPTVRVRGKVTCKELGTAPKLVNSYWSFGDFRMASCSSQEAGIDVRLPQGECSWYLYDDYFTPKDGTVTLSVEEPEVDLGAIDLPAHFLAKNEGHVLPDWTVTEARGVPLEAAQIADFRGKWLLIEFWGYW